MVTKVLGNVFAFVRFINDTNDVHAILRKRLYGSRYRSSPLPFGRAFGLAAAAVWSAAARGPVGGGTTAGGVVMDDFATVAGVADGEMSTTTPTVQNAVDGYSNG